jgi:hypothetical protein
MPTSDKKKQIFLKKINFSLVQGEFELIITEAMQFISGLEFTMTQGLPQEKLAALRQCVEKIHINKSGNEVKMQIREISTGNLQAVQESEIPF